MLGQLEFEPDQLTLELLQAEHLNGTWIGKELLPIASRIRNLGGSEDDYFRWVTASNLWLSYTGSTGDSVKKQNASLASAWEKSADSEPFELEEALSDLRTQIGAYTDWPNSRTASRDRAVALALVDFCIENNCFTRTLSSYELAKWTAGMSQRSVSRALVALTDLSLIREVQRTDRRTSTRSTKRYQVNLRWAASAGCQQSPNRGVSTTDSRSTGKASLSHELPPPYDLWSRAGLGLGAQRVYEVLNDEPVTARSVAEQTGMNRPSAKRYLRKLADHALAGSKPGAPGEPTFWFRVDTPLDAVADAMGIYGHVEIKRWEIENRQHANRSAYPGSYRRNGGTQQHPTERNN
jgi:DNA-binding transcriptional ArsR family regulator